MTTMSLKQRHLMNEAALTMLAQGRTDDEAKATLQRYSGQGGVGASTDEYYTPAALAKAVVELTLPLAPAETPALEPTCGTGTFLAYLPAGSTGVEIGSVAAQIARTLHEHSVVEHMPFESFATKQKEPSFGYVTGNPPFGTRRTPGLDRPNIREASRYVLGRCLDLTVNGGVIALIVPNGIARHEAGQEFRKNILRAADVLGCFGLPTDTFAQAHASLATTDVLVLRRRTRTDEAQATLNAASMDAILDHPEHRAFLEGRIFTVRPEWLFGEETTRPGPAGRPVYARNGTLEDAIKGINSALLVHPDFKKSLNSIYDDLDSNTRNRIYALAQHLKHPTPTPGDTREEKGQLQVYYRRWHAVTPEENIIAQACEKLGMGISAHAEAVALQLQTKAGQLAEQLQPAIERLNMDAQMHLPLLRRLKHHNPHILAAVTVFESESRALPATKAGDPDLIRTAFDRLREAHGTVTTLIASTEFGVDEADAAQTLSKAGYMLAASAWLTPAEYLSGDLSLRLNQLDMMTCHDGTPDHVRSIAEHQRGVLARGAHRLPLRAIPITPSNTLITAEMLAEWVESHYRISDLRGVMDISITKRGNDVEVDGWAASKWTKTLNYIRRYLTGRNRLKIEQDAYAASDESLRTYILAHHGKALEAAYDEQTTYLRPVYDTRSVTALAPAYEGPEPHPNQNEAVRRSLIEKNILDAQDVGLGKTLTGLLDAAISYKETGRTSVIAVPRNVHHKWHTAMMQAFPHLGGMSAEFDGERSFSDSMRLSERIRQAIHRGAPILLITHETLTRIRMPSTLTTEILNDEFGIQQGGRPSGMNDRLYSMYANAQVDAWLEAGEITVEDLEDAAAQASKVKDEAAALFGDTDTSLGRENRAAEARRLRFIASKQSRAANEAMHPLDVTWTEINTGLLVIDEAHRFRRLMTVSGRNAIRYLGASQDTSLRAVDALLKIRHTQSNNGRVHLLTATPVHNSLTDLYNMIHLTDPQVFARHGVLSIDAFVERYAETEVQVIADEDGNEQHVTALVGIKHVEELQSVIRRVIHRRTAADVGMHVPRVEREFHLSSVDEAQENVISFIAEEPLRAIQSYLRPDLVIPEDQKAQDEILERFRITLGSLIRRAELDLGLIDPAQFPDHLSPKVDGLITAIAAHLQQHSKVVVFCDTLHYPKKSTLPDRHFHEKLARLISERAGIPRSAIGLINGHDTPESDDRLAVTDAFNGDKLRVVIGTRAAMGEGIDLQQDCVQGFGADVPWTPGIQHQTEGRVARYPNPAEVVRFDYFLSNRALDPHMLDVLSGKMNWYEMLMNSAGDHIRTTFGAHAPSLEEIRILRLRDAGARDAALRAIREREAAAQQRAEQQRALKAAQAYQLAAADLHVARASNAAERNPTLYASQMLATQLAAQNLAVHKDHLPVPEAAFLAEGGWVLAWKGQVIKTGALMQVEFPPTKKYDVTSGKNGLYVVTSVDTASGSLTITPTADADGHKVRTDPLTLSLRSMPVIRVLTPEELLQEHAQPDHPRLPEAFHPALQKVLKARLLQAGQPSFILRDGAVKFRIPRQRDEVITSITREAHRLSIEAFLQSREGHDAAEQAAPDINPSLWWATPGTPQHAWWTLNT